MSDYIERENAKHAVWGCTRDTGIDEAPFEYAEGLLENVPSADVAPVRRGHWIEEQDRIVCSECGARFRDEIIYMQENKPGAPHRCLECGAIMDQEVPTNG